MFLCNALQSGRLCIAVPSSEAQPKGMVLGGSSVAGVLYVEPQAAIPLNNDLAAARGEAYAAVESVLWSLTGLIADAEDDMQLALDTVSHCRPMITRRPEVALPVQSVQPNGIAVFGSNALCRHYHSCLDAYLTPYLLESALDFGSKCVMVPFLGVVAGHHGCQGQVRALD